MSKLKLIPTFHKYILGFVCLFACGFFFLLSIKISVCFSRPLCRYFQVSFGILCDQKCQRQICFSLKKKTAREYLLPVNIDMYTFLGIIKGKSNNYEDIRLLGTLSSINCFFSYWLPMQISDQFYFLAIFFKFDKMKKTQNKFNDFKKQ